MDTATLLWDILLPLLGFFYLSYARIRRRATPLIGGLLLIVLPYVTSNGYMLLLALIAVVAGVYFIAV
jgi:hypothetical protein